MAIMCCSYVGFSFSTVSPISTVSTVSTLVLWEVRKYPLGTSQYHAWYGDLRIPRVSLRVGVYAYYACYARLS